MSGAPVRAHRLPAGLVSSFEIRPECGVRGAAICRGALLGVVRVPAYEVPGGLVPQIASVLRALASCWGWQSLCAGSTQAFAVVLKLHVRGLRCTSSPRAATLCNERCIEEHIALALQGSTLQSIAAAG